MPFLPALLAALGVSMKWIIASSIGFLIVKTVAMLGLTVVTYAGMSFALSFFTDRVQSELGSSVAIGEILGLMGVDVGMSLVFSAISIRLAVTAAGGAFSRISIVPGQ